MASTLGRKRSGAAHLPSRRRHEFHPRLENLEDRCLMSSGSYLQTDLVSDIAGMAPNTDPSLVNPWGLVFNPTGAFWVSDNGTGLSTLYNGTGQPFPVNTPLIVTIPTPEGGESP